MAFLQGWLRWCNSDGDVQNCSNVQSSTAPDSQSLMKTIEKLPGASVIWQLYRTVSYLVTLRKSQSYLGYQSKGQPGLKIILKMVVNNTVKQF